MGAFIIAEAGVNHNGDIQLAKKMCEVAKNAGADCVKFQTYITENDTTVSCEKADYQNGIGKDNQFQMLKKLELSFEHFRELKKYCDEIGIEFCSTPFDIDSAKFLNELGVRFWKIASSEVQNYQLIKFCADTGKQIVLSTGMCDYDDIDECVKLIKSCNNHNIIILHCNTEYPTPFEDVNLLALNGIKKRYNCDVGYSDHTLGIEIPIASVALGCKVIEKHFTIDRTLAGPDHAASLEPDELRKMVTSVRNIEKSLGSNEKKRSQSEIKNIIAARKSIVAKTIIKKGELFTENNIIAKRPGGGINPMKWEQVIGQKANRDYSIDEMIEL